MKNDLEFAFASNPLINEKNVLWILRTAKESENRDQVETALNAARNYRKMFIFKYKSKTGKKYNGEYDGIFNFIETEICKCLKTKEWIEDYYFEKMSRTNNIQPKSLGSVFGNLIYRKLLKLRA